MRSFVERQEKEVQKEKGRDPYVPNLKILLLSSVDLFFKEIPGQCNIAGSPLGIKILTRALINLITCIN